MTYLIKYTEIPTGSTKKHRNCSTFALDNVQAEHFKSHCR